MADKWGKEIKPQLEDAFRSDMERYDRLKSRVYNAKALRALTPATSKTSMVRTVDQAMAPGFMWMSLPSRTSVSELPSKMSVSKEDIPISSHSPKRDNADLRCYVADATQMQCTPHARRHRASTRHPSHVVHSSFPHHHHQPPPI